MASVTFIVPIAHFQLWFLGHFKPLIHSPSNILSPVPLRCSFKSYLMDDSECHFDRNAFPAMAPRCSPNHWCFALELRSLLQGSTDTGSLVLSRVAIAHKLLRISGSASDSIHIFSVPQSPSSPSSNGQRCHSVFHKPPSHCFRYPVHPWPGSVALVHQPQHTAGRNARSQKSHADPFQTTLIGHEQYINNAVLTAIFKMFGFVETDALPFWRVPSIQCF